MSNDAVRDRSGAKAEKPRILVSVPPREGTAFFPQGALAALAPLTDAVDLVEPRDIAAVPRFDDTEIAVVAWGFPALDADLLSRMPRLRLVVNAASSIRALVTPDFWATRIPICQSGAAMSPAVAEMSLTLTLSLLRRTQRMDHALRSGAEWEQVRAIPRAREISGSRIGVVGASRTGREYVQMCSALGAEIRIHDPYVPVDDPLHALTSKLDELMAWSDVIALHAPATPETAGMIDRGRLALMRDGGAVVNTARSSLIDMDALYDEVATGRLDAALDVYESEPLPLDDRWRALRNALLTGHVSGATAESRARAGRIVVEEITRFLSGEDLQHRVTPTMLERMG